MPLLKEAMDQGVRNGVFPGGVLLAAIQGHVRVLTCSGATEYLNQPRPVTPDTIYDLASLTKPLATVVLIMLMTESGTLDPDQPLADFVPVPKDKKKITLGLLLSHASGLPAWRPFFERWGKISPGRPRAGAAQDVLAEPLVHHPGTRALYSDLNFILLGLVLEQASGLRQDDLFDQRIARPLGLKSTGYRPVDRIRALDPSPVAPTEHVPRRGGIIRGVVHDDNAAALSGVAGHAGLFGTAGEIWTILNALRSAFLKHPCPLPLSSETVRRFWQIAGSAPDSTWTLGFDTPSPEGSSAGRFFSRQSVGHLGYTGTSLWFDPKADLAAILLTNRVHPSARNTGIRAFRPHIHDQVFQTLTREP